MGLMIYLCKFLIIHCYLYYMGNFCYFHTVSENSHLPCQTVSNSVNQDQQGVKLQISHVLLSYDSISIVPMNTNQIINMSVIVNKLLVLLIIVNPIFKTDSQVRND